ncbi:MAG: filamentous hemagglutinin N-terminal domain-containing protein [Cyanobacteria bacterium SBC]|nr:filamentous hemagglutinin N-terminal domain-containing protein [Cyanobacteria bacterium SBC]
MALPSAYAQIVPDSTLPVNSHIVETGSEISIEEGTTVNNLLFHSFSEFSVPVDTIARFNNLPNIETIFSRVTGSEISRIEGTLAANGSASLFFINPNGIVFGENARLDIGGSFLASTAESIWFDNGSQFTVEPNAEPLLTVSVPVGVQFGETPGDIVNRSSAVSEIPGLPEALPPATGLTVLPGNALTLIGGDVRLESGDLTAFQGQIHVGSVGDGGNVQFGQTPTGLMFDYANAPQLGSIDLSNGAAVNASGLGGGSIELRGENINLVGSASLRADTFGDFDGRGIDVNAGTLRLSDGAFVSSSTFGSGVGGDLTVNANLVELTGTTPGAILGQLVFGLFDFVTLSDGLYVLSAGAGNAGRATFNVDRLTLQNGAAIVTTTLTGRGGDITVRSSESLEVLSGSLLISGTAGTGDAGNVEITVDRLEIFEGGFVSTSSGDATTGNVGNLTVRADTIELRDTPAGSLIPGGLFTATLGLGDAGDLSIETRQLRVLGGMQISAATSSAGQGGNLSIDATESIELDGFSPDRTRFSGVFTTSSVLDGFGQAGTAGAGNLQIDTQRLALRNGARISAATGGAGAAGTLTVNATESVDLSGSIVSGSGRVEPSALFSESLSTGNAGDLQVNTNRLSVRDGAEITVRGQGTGAAGNLEIDAVEVDLADNASVGASNVDGLGGNVVLRIDRLSLANGAQIETNTLGSGRAGNIDIRSTESIEVRGVSSPNADMPNALVETEQSAISASAFFLNETVRETLNVSATPSGDSGNISIETNALTVDRNGLISVRNDGLGNPGRIDIHADTISLLDRGGITAVSTSGSGGNISIDTRALSLDTGFVNASAIGDGTGGNISIRASESLEISGSGFVDLLESIFIPALFGQVTLANAQQGIVAATDREGTAGNISIDTGRLVMDEGAFVGTATLGEGNAGDLSVTATESISVTSSFMASSTAGSGAGGNLTVTSPRIHLVDGATFSTTTLSSGSAGNLTIRASESVNLEGIAPTGEPRTTLTAGSTVATTGTGGSISIETPRLSVRDGAEISVSSQGRGNAGDAIVNGGVLTLEDGLLNATSLLGQGGNVELNMTDAVVLREGSQITTQAGTAATGGGDGGNITITTGAVALLEGSRINANALEGSGGNIQIATQGLFLDLRRGAGRDRTSQITASSQFGIDGTIDIQTPEIDAGTVLVDLPEDPIDPNQQIAQGCSASTGNTFVITGRGGVPENPIENLRNTASWGDVRDWRTLGEERTSNYVSQENSVVNRESRNRVEEISLVEATTWVRLSDGTVQLLAQPRQSQVALGEIDGQCEEMKR